VGAIVSLTEYSLHQDTLERYGMEYLHLPITDYHPPSIEQIQQCVAFIDRVAQEKGVATLIHCLAGRGRTGTMLAAYLVHHNKGMKAEDAIGIVREKRPGSMETPE